MPVVEGRKAPAFPPQDARGDKHARKDCAGKGVIRSTVRHWARVSKAAEPPAKVLEALEEGE